MNEIILLSQDTIDKIAAGEVVERPASVVKELVENAVDAGANAITVEIKDGGTSLVRITDNGCGIPKEQVRIAYQQHATSKIRKVEDLLTSGTLGFRGEALSSIAAVSQVEMITKTAGSLTGVRYVIEGGSEKNLEEIGAPEGTTFLVHNLFFNTPARKKFLKSAAGEAGCVSDLMERMALSHPEIAFKFISNRDTKLHTSGNCNLKDIIYSIYGRDIASNLLKIDADYGNIKITGFIGKPVISRGNRNYENYFVNDRYVKSAIVARAIEDAYKAFMMSHRYPFTVLKLQIDTEEVDVNVHPQKMEVRFSNQQDVYEKVCQAVKEALLGKGMVDLKACFQFARANGALQIVDMDAATLEDTCRAGKMLSGWTGDRDNTDSILCTMDVETGEETVLHEFPGIIEAPNWLNDGNTLLYNADGKIYRYEIDKDHVEQVDTGFCVQCNNDHVPSPDNQLLAVSCMPPELTDGTYESHIYVLPMTGGEPKDLTGPGLSYLHGWSPDGKELAYCAFRKKPEEETMRIEICTIPSDGGEETCLTDGKGYNDGPEYSPDGKHIWFNSTRSGLMQVWRMNRDGSGLTQMTDSDANNWFGHVSPDGKHVIYLTFAKGELEPNEHLPNMYVSLGMMDYDGQNKKKLLDLFGGQGSINVNSWAPDSRRIAYVKYVLHHK